MMGLLAMTETNYLSDQLSQIKVKKTPPEFQFQTSEYDVHLVFKVQNECRLNNYKTKGREVLFDISHMRFRFCYLDCPGSLGRGSVTWGGIGVQSVVEQKNKFQMYQKTINL